jgi:hypothetical protein
VCRHVACSRAAGRAFPGARELRARRRLRLSSPEQPGPPYERAGLFASRSRKIPVAQ